VLLLVAVQAPATAAAGGTVPLTANASWLECKEACIPAKAVLGLELPVRSAAAGAVAAHAPLFQASCQRLPRPAPGWRCLGRRRDEQRTDGDSSRAGRLSINSSGEGKQGYHTAAEVNALLKEKGAAPSAFSSAE
jgi:hypothetical protein